MGVRNYTQRPIRPTVRYGSNLLNNTIIIQLWGAGGGGGTPGGWSFGAEGGGGGYIYAEVPILRLAGQTLILQVGEGGLVNGSRVSFGGGGQANRTGSDNRYGSNGGGYTGLFLNSVSQANAIAIAGGGGGGGSSRAGAGNIGGAGGGQTGQDGVSAYDNKVSYRGIGGTQSAGGTEASSDAVNTSFPAAALIGGTCRVNGYGGAGGGGYWGGSAGGYSESNTMGGGGGGSGYLNPSFVSFGRNVQGNFKVPAGIFEDGFPGLETSYGGNASAAGKNGFARITISGVVYEYSYTGTNISIPIPNLLRNTDIIGSGLLLSLDAGNVNSYPGSGNTWFDVSGNSNNGTLNNITYNSNNGGSLVYTSTSITTVPMTNLRPTTSITQESWFLITNNVGQVFIGSQYGTQSNNSYALWLEYTNLFAAGVNIGGSFNFQTFSSSISTNVWYHYIHTYDGSNQRMYINGSQVFSWATTGSIAYDTNNTLLAVGNDWNGSGYNVGAGVGVQGRLAIVRIYNRALSASEVSQNYNALRSRFGV